MLIPGNVKNEYNTGQGILSRAMDWKSLQTLRRDYKEYNRLGVGKKPSS